MDGARQFGYRDLPVECEERNSFGVKENKDLRSYKWKSPVTIGECLGVSLLSYIVSMSQKF
jgi:hypothetical protein